jgi:hypothetical protein
MNELCVPYTFHYPILTKINPYHNPSISLSHYIVRQQLYRQRRIRVQFNDPVYAAYIYTHK